MKITDLQVNKKIINNLLELGYEDLTEIQEQLIEPMLNNQNVLAQAQTGSGKTAAFLVPIIHKISINRKLKGLVIAPTRDLSNQIFDNAIQYAKGVGVRCANFFGGSSYSRQIKFLEAGIDLVIGTPGRLLDLHDRRKLNLQDINFLVLDEADQMLDMGFIDDIRKIVRAIGPLDQTSLFSATIPKEIMRFVTELMPEHVSVKVESKINVNDVIKQSVYIVDTKNKPKLLVDILGDSDRTKQQAIVFSRTRSEAADIAHYLKTSGFKVEALHSDRSQSSRTKALRDFRDNRVQILVATNVAARGIDINDLPLVINYNLPENKETYVHRIGRTGRVGKKGEAISFMTKNDGAMLRDIEKLINMKIEIIDKQEYSYADKDAEVIIRESQIKRGGGRSSGGSRGGSRGGFGGGRSSGGDFRPRREGGSFNRSDRGSSFRPRGDGEQSSYRPRGDGEQSSYRPRGDGEQSSGRSERSFSRPEGSSYAGRSEQSGFRRSERSSSFERKPYNSDDRGFRGNSEFSGSQDGNRSFNRNVKRDTDKKYDSERKEKSFKKYDDFKTAPKGDSVRRAPRDYSKKEFSSRTPRRTFSK